MPIYEMPFIRFGKTANGFQIQHGNGWNMSRGPSRHNVCRKGPLKQNRMQLYANWER